MTEIFPTGNPAKFCVIRLNPGDDLKECLQRVALTSKMKAAVVVSCVGSLVQYNLRFANKKEGHLGKGHFEILSLTGTLSETSAHLHLCISDTDGSCTGGHLLGNNLIYTTAEVLIAELPGIEFARVPDPMTGYHELHIRPGEIARADE